MGTPTRFPHLIRDQSVVVRIVRTKAKSTVSGFCYTVSWVGPNGRERLNRTDFAEAEAEARTKAAQLAAGIAAANMVSNSDITELTQAREIVAEHGIPLVSAVAEWSKAKSLAGTSLINLCEEWSRKRTASVQRVKVADAVTQFITAKNAAKQEGTRTYGAKLKPVSEHFGEYYLDSISTKDWTKFLARYENGVTHNDIRKKIVTLCRWSQKNNYLSEDIKPEIEKTDRHKEERSPIGILSPKEFGNILAFIRKHYPQHLAALVVAGFCGVRGDEIQGKRDKREIRQLWSDIHTKPQKNDYAFLKVTIAKENTPADRIVHLQKAALTWLKVCPKPHQGSICEEGAIEKIRLILRKAKFHLPENCFRHSWITYRIAVTQDKAHTATEAGNSVQEIDRRYRVPKPRHEGIAWFALRPSRSKNKK